MKVFDTLESMEEFILDDNPYQGRPWILGEGVDEPDILVVKSIPSFTDLRSRRLFMGEDGIIVRQIMMELGAKPYFTAGIPFIPDNGRVRVADAEKFTPLLSETIKRVGAKNIVVFGLDAVKMMKEFTHPVKTLNSLLGQTWESEGYRFRVFPHTITLARNPASFDTVRGELMEFLYPESSKKPAKVAMEAYVVHHTRETADEALRNLVDPVACDIESTGLNKFEDRILTLQLSWKEGTGHSFPWDLYSPEEWAELLGPRKLIFQNGSFDVKFLEHNGVKVRVHEDTMIMHSLIDETPGTHSMEQMAPRYLGVEKWGDSINYEDMEGNDPDVLGRYGARDADITLRLANQFRPQVDKRRIHSVLRDTHNAIIDSEIFGIKVDREKALQFQEEIDKALHDRREYINDVYGLANPNSPQQVAKILYEDMGLPVQKTAGRVTTNEEALERLEGEAIVNDILEYRHLTKANGTYIRNILELSKHDGRYHPEFRLAGTETGRLTEPLLLVLPRAEDVDTYSLGKKYQYRLRELFIPDEGHLMIGSDYSGLEIGMAAHITGDVKLIQDVRRMRDTHSVVANTAFDLGIPEEPLETLKARTEEVHGYERTIAKAGVFAWLFGGDARTISRNLGISMEVAERIFDTLKGLYAGIDSWQQLTRAQVQEEGFVETPWGRRRNFNFNPSFSRRIVEEQLRESTNMPIQGMASDMNLHAFSVLHSMGVRTLFPFHDATYVQAPEDQAEKTAALVKKVMEEALPSPVPFRADVKIGKNLGAL